MAISAAPALSAFSYAGCPDVTDADFKVTTLVSHATNPETSEPLKLAFDMDAAGNVDVYFVQRFGLLRKYDAAKKTVVNLAKFTVPTGGSDGLIGIALDPAFKTNKWIYLYYSTNTDWRLGRFTLNGDQLDMASEKVLLTIVESAGSVHTGGAMQFDWEGNLWLTVGDNAKGTPAANTNDLRGKILRIHPTADGKYTIPAGNLFPEGTAKTRPEIYIMGNRNPYSISLDPVRKAVTWGDVGPDFGGISEEHDFTTKPGFFGWPYYAGNNLVLGGGGTAAAPINNDGGNTGLTNLPPAIPALDSYRQSCSLTGPVYYYDWNSKSPGRLPPHFNGMWFVSDFSKGKVEALTLDATGSKIISRAPIFDNIKITSPLDFQAGPDGNMYIANYAGYRTTSDATGLLKIEYTGSCAPVGIAPQGPVAQGNSNPGSGFEMQGASLAITASGRHTWEVADLSGRSVLRRNGNGPAIYDLARAGNAGVYLLTVVTEQGSLTRKIVRP
ncbi:MAG: hypothetical protein JWO30_114 [Fibrobacteres bacterium]|nr:hypothetical protein [Fibrobacterota bacterium]